MSSSGGGDFRAWRVEETEDGGFVGSEQILSHCADDIDENKGKRVLIKVTHSSLNYKDALSASGNKGVTRKFPHTPGIDAAGTIVGDPNSNYNASALVTGYVRTTTASLYERKRN